MKLSPALILLLEQELTHACPLLSVALNYEETAQYFNAADLNKQMDKPGNSVSEYWEFTTTMILLMLEANDSES